MTETKNEKGFEESMKRLEEIVRQLETGTLPVEEALSRFEEGMKLAGHCSKVLEAAELKVTKLVKAQEKANGQQPAANSP